MDDDNWQAGAAFGGLRAARMLGPPVNGREHLVLEIDQIKLNLRRAELRLKDHDEREVVRKQQEEATLHVRPNLNPSVRGSQMGQAE